MLIGLFASTEMGKELDRNRLIWFVLNNWKSVFKKIISEIKQIGILVKQFMHLFKGKESGSLLKWVVSAQIAANPAI